MARVSTILPEKYKQIALENGISIATVYNRLKNDWDLEKAVTKKPRTSNIKRRTENGEIITIRKKYPISITFFEDKKELLEESIEESGLTRSEYIAKVLEDHLDEK